MGILKDAGESLLKYGEIIVNKTEEYTKIAKLNLDIKRFQGEIDNAEKELGQLIIKKIESGETNFDINDSTVKGLTAKVKKIREDIEAKRDEIETIKKSKSENKKKRDDTNIEDVRDEKS